MPAPVQAVITLSFDPVVAVGQFGVRLETLGIAAAILVALVAAALVAGRTPIAAAGSGSGSGSASDNTHLRRDDLLFVALGATAGAVVAGRVGYLLLYADYFRDAPYTWADPTSGSFELSLAVAGGTLGGLAVAALLEGGAGRWAHAAALPLLLGLALGKAALMLGGSGQGQPADVGWAVAYAGPGPWGSLAASVPSHPSQLYEAAGYAIAFLLLAIVLAGGGFGRRDGRLLGTALVLVAIVRAAVAFTWRNPPILGQIRVEHLLALVVWAIGLGLWVAFARADARARRANEEPNWPDPGVAHAWRGEPDRR